MKKLLFTVALIFSVVFISCNGNKNDSSENKKTFTDEEIKAESARINKFLDSIFDSELSRDPNYASTQGLKTNYDKWTDISDAHKQEELEFKKIDLDALHKNFNLESLDEQAQISFRLFERDCKDWRRAKAFLGSKYQ